MLSLMPSDYGERDVNSDGERKGLGEVLGWDRSKLGLVRQPQLGPRVLGCGVHPAVRLRQSCHGGKFGKCLGSYE